MLRRLMILVCLLVIVGCVERSVTINSQPQGAIVYLNDKEIGRTPVTVPFEWYGDYDIILRKEGMETVKTHEKIVQPWYEYMPFDIFSELLYPGTIHNDHYMEFELQPAEVVDIKDLEQRALDIRAQARGEETK